jgi:hypothetical protein
MGNAFTAKKFDTCTIVLKKFDIYSKIVFRDAGNFFRHQAELVLHRVSFETSFDSKQPKLELILVFGTIRNKTFVPVVSLLYRNREF